MNSLPESRRVIYGRTHASMYRHEAHDPIRHYRSHWARLADAMAALVLGVLGAVALVAWWAA